MDTYSEYYQQLQVINEMLENTPEGPERDELVSFKENIEELLSLAEQTLSVADPEKDSLANTDCQDKHESNSSKKQKLDNEYALVTASINKEGAVKLATEYDANNQPLEGTNNVNFKELKGQKFRIPHKHQPGQLAYHNVMVWSVPQDIPDLDLLEVKVMYLNPTHKEMLPCPNYFDLERDCSFSDEQCEFSHGELVPYFSLQKYVEPKFIFRSLGIGSEVLARQSDGLWYRGKIASIAKRKSMVKVDFANNRIGDYEGVFFKHIRPLEQSELESADKHGSDVQGSSRTEAMDETASNSITGLSGATEHISGRKRKRRRRRKKMISEGAGGVREVKNDIHLK